MITPRHLHTIGGQHVVNVMIGGTTSGYPEEEYVKKVFMIEGHQPKKQKLIPNNPSLSQMKIYSSINSRHADALVVKLDVADNNVMKY